MTCFLLVTDYAGQGIHITSPVVLAPLSVFIISIVALVYIENHISSCPMLAPALFKQKGATLHYLVQALLMSAQFSVGSLSLSVFRLLQPHLTSIFNHNNAKLCTPHF